MSCLFLRELTTIEKNVWKFSFSQELYFFPLLICNCACMGVCVCACACVCVCACACVCVHVHVSVCMCACASVWVGAFVWSTMYLLYVCVGAI